MGPQPKQWVDGISATSFFCKEPGLATAKTNQSAVERGIFHSARSEGKTGPGAGALALGFTTSIADFTLLGSSCIQGVIAAPLNFAALAPTATVTGAKFSH